MASQRSDSRPTVTGKAYPWIVVGLLWVCGFLNYADRQAVTAVFPILEKEFNLSKAQIGWIGSAFMIVYATSAPIAGYFVDQWPRRILISVGLAFWSFICGMTALSRGFYQLVFFRGAEGLGESFYFPASMSVLADYHGPRTRSRAMSIHQTSVYVGQAGGVILAAALAKEYGWQSPFWILGGIGILYAIFLGLILREPTREQSALHQNAEESLSNPDPHAGPRHENPGESFSWSSFAGKVAKVLENPGVLLLLLVFVGANFVASSFLVWLVTFIDAKFKNALTVSAAISSAWSVASLFGALLGGVLADRAAKRRGGRIRVQAFGLLIGAPFLLLAGQAPTEVSLILGLIGAGLCKGVYDSNIFASLYDVVRPEDRGFAAGLMNTVGWTGGAISPVVVGYSADYFGLSAAFAAMAAVYIAVGALALTAAKLAETRLSDPPAL